MLVLAWLGPPWLNLGLSEFSSICESKALAQKKCLQTIASFDTEHMNKLLVFITWNAISLNVHEIIMIALNVVFSKMRLLSVASMAPVSGKFGLTSASHTPDNSTGSPEVDSFCNAASRAWMFLGASIMRRTICPKMSNTFATVDMSDERTGQSKRTQHCTDERKIFCRFWRDVFCYCHPRPGTGTGSGTWKAGQQASTPHPCTVDRSGFRL